MEPNALAHFLLPAPHSPACRVPGVRFGRSNSQRLGLGLSEPKARFWGEPRRARRGMMNGLSGVSRERVKMGGQRLTVVEVVFCWVPSHGSGWGLFGSADVVDGCCDPKGT